MKQKIFLLALILFAQSAWAADEKFTFSVGNKIYIPREEIEITFTLNKCNQNLKVRPTVDKGLVEIYDAKNSRWVSGNNWDYPYITEKMKIRISNINDTKILLKLEFQDTKVGYTQISKGTGIWVSDALSKYVSRVNEGILAKTLQSVDGKIHE